MRPAATSRPSGPTRPIARIAGLVSAYVAAAGRRLPRGWTDLGRQFAIWFGFLGIYQIARGAADRGVGEAMRNGQWVIDAQRSLHSMIELELQKLVEHSRVLEALASWSYWMSEFTVVAGTLLYVYIRHHAHFFRFRNTLLLANTIGLVGYVAMPTAPPRFFPEAGFHDTLAQYGSLNHGTGLIQLASNQFAAMPSLHSADALVVGLVMATIVRRRWVKALWLSWPLWVWFSVMSTGNHFWLDIAVGLVVAGIAASVIYKPWRRRA